MTLFSALYRLLLRRAPAAFRLHYAEEMTQLAAARVAERRGLPRTWRACRELADLAATVSRERRCAAPPRAGGSQAAADLRTALTTLRRTPAATAAIAGMLTVGLGAGCFGFSILSTVLLRPLPFDQPDRLTLLWGFARQLQVGFPEIPLHGLRLIDLRRTTKSFEAIEGFKADVFNLDGSGLASERIDGLRTTATLFDTLGVQPAAGRFFSTNADSPGAPCTVVVGYGLWQRRFGGDASTVGRVVHLSDEPCTIVGVAPRGFDFPRGGEMPASFQYPTHTELWMASPAPTSGPSDLTVLARLRSGVSAATAQAELDVQAKARDQQVRGSRGWNDIRLVPLAQQIVPPAIALTVSALFGAVVMLLLVAAGNASQLCVVRGLRRRQDLTIRAALGASPARLARVAAFESLLMTTAGALSGIVLADVAIHAVRAIGPARFPRLAEAALDPSAIFFLIAAAFVVAGATACGPIVLAHRASVDTVPRGRSRGNSDHLRGPRGALVAFQTSLAVLLVAASVLLARGVAARLAVDPGFRADHALTFDITLPPARYPETLRGPVPAIRPQIVEAIDRYLSRLRALPGVTSAAMGKPLPMSGAQEGSAIAVEGRPAPKSAAEVPISEYIVVSDDFFRALGTPILAGREFSGRDNEHSEQVVVINETMAHQFWPGGSALGRRVKLGGLPTSPAPWLTVVGVVTDMKRFGLDDKPGPAMYVHYAQGGYPTLSTVPFIVRTNAADPMALLSGARAAARDAGLDAPVAAPETLASLLARVSADARFATLLMIAFAAAAVVLTIAGTYGIVAFAVSERRRELGIRAALGALPSELVRLVMLEGLKPAVIGGVLGVLASIWAGYLLRGLLFGVSPIDPMTFVAVPSGFAVLTACACFLSALPSASADPRETLSE